MAGLRNAVLGSVGNFGGVATTRQGGTNFVPTPLKGSISMPNFRSMLHRHLAMQAEDPENYKALKQAGGGQMARYDFGATR
jgi:hypothetical protein